MLENIKEKGDVAQDIKSTAIKRKKEHINLSIF